MSDDDTEPTQSETDEIDNSDGFQQISRELISAATNPSRDCSTIF